MKCRVIFVIGVLLVVGCGEAERIQESGSGTAMPEKSFVTEGSTDWLWKYFIAEVIEVVDGDTIDVLTEAKQTIRIRIEGIESPEPGQPFHNDARERLRKLIAGREVCVLPIKEDEDGVTIADVRQGRVNVDFVMLREGLAWHCDENDDYSRRAQYEKEAKEEKCGLWSGGQKPIPPWEWRKMSAAERNEYR